MRQSDGLSEVADAGLLPVFIHGDLQVDHVFVAGDEVTCVIDWSEGGRGDALFDLATLTLGHPEHLGDVIAGYGTDVDLSLIRAWWAMRCLSNVRWLVEHGYGPPEKYPEVAVLRSSLEAGGRVQAQSITDRQNVLNLPLSGREA